MSIATSISPVFSIVICTYNRKMLLLDCINSIFSMNFPKSGYELIIVDGGSTDGTQEMCSQHPEIKFIVEKKFGLAHARNKGAESARGSIVVYTDDDCVVDENWLKNLMFGFQDYPHIMAAGGRVLPLHPEIIPSKFLVRPALGLFDEGQDVKAVSGLITSNLAVKRELFKRVNFDENLGITRKGKLLVSGEDDDFCKSIIDTGGVVFYLPHVKVFHQVRRNRANARYIIKHALHSGISITKHARKEHEVNTYLWLVRSSLSGLIQTVSELLYDRSFTSCYKILMSFSALIVCATGLDRLL